MSILKAIEGGAETLYEIIERSYGDVDPRLWIVASSNVRLHVDHLAYQGKLPKVIFVKPFCKDSLRYQAFKFVIGYTVFNFLVSVKWIADYGPSYMIVSYLEG